MEDLNKKNNSNKLESVKKAGETILKIVPTIMTVLLSLMSLLTELVATIAKLPLQLVGKGAEKFNEMIGDKKFMKDNPMLANIMKAPGEAVKAVSGLSTDIINATNKFTHKLIDVPLDITKGASLDFGKKIANIVHAKDEHGNDQINRSNRENSYVKIGKTYGLKPAIERASAKLNLKDSKGPSSARGGTW